MKSLNKSVSSVFLAFLLALTMISGFAVPVNAVTNEPSRVINIVYDDSTSMYAAGSGKNYREYDTWCYAKYAMEVFVSMMGDKDTINIYYMSDYSGNDAPGPRITLHGSDGVASNVAKIHNAKTEDGGTPFNSVVKAYSDLKATTADKKSLVVLTDGKFDKQEGKPADKEGYLDHKKIVEPFFSNTKEDDIDVCFLGIGNNVNLLKKDAKRNIYSAHAKTEKQVLKELTIISSRVFEKNKLPNVNEKNPKADVDVSMQELIVFAQGKNVTINGIKGSDGKLIQSTEASVTVQYSECDSTKPNRNNKPVDTLMGKIATFKTAFPAGSYTFDVSGADTLEVYYKPNLETSVTLTDSEGNPVNLSEEGKGKIKAGDYKLSVNLIDAITGKPVTSSKLLGAVNIEATVTNNEETKTFKNGDTIHLVQGDVHIDASATYLEYNTLETEENFKVGVDKTISFSVSKDVNYEVDKNGFKNNDYVIVHATVDGREFTAEEWAALDTPTIDLYQKDEKHPLSFLSRIIALFSQINGTYDKPVIEKGDAVGDLKIRPSLPDGKPTAGNYVDSDYIIKCSQVINYESWDGSETGTFKVTDSRSFIAKYWRFFIFCLVLAIILILLIGYLPFIKHYLPKGLKHRPLIEITGYGNEIPDTNGKVIKNPLFTILPYAAERAEITYVPLVFMGFPKLRVKAVGGGKQMKVTNPNDFIDKPVAIGFKEITAKNENVYLTINKSIKATNENELDAICYLNKKG